jgi:hypothetical protein
VRVDLAAGEELLLDLEVLLEVGGVVEEEAFEVGHIAVLRKEASEELGELLGDGSDVRPWNLGVLLLETPS